MKGDFSNWRFDPRNNDQGVLFQQGRVTLDSDLTEAGLIELTWRTVAGRDVIGAGVAAVPAEDPDGYRIDSARVQDGAVHLTVRPGRIWADGQLLYLPADPADPAAALDRVATYLEPPMNAATVSEDDIGDGIRDAVVLEFTLEELNGFQQPDRLIEPALGGPDTAERIAVRQAFRLLRLAPGEDCNNIRNRLADGPSGRLTVSLTPPEEDDGECPVVAGGGYTGFEHNLYRVEVGAADSGGPYFKWSRFNGGLVGRGEFLITGTIREVVITANRTAIVQSGQTSFYLEALSYDEALGHWRVAYGTTATVNDQQNLELADPPTYGTFPSPGAGETVFFRLWDGLEPVADYTDATAPVELRDGIRLVFEPPASADYRPGDYWTFAVRAGEVSNPEVLLDDRLPDGPLYRRVPLAEIDWTAARDTAEGGAVEDCRRRFNPLTRQRVCCTLLVGDGLSSFGDFNRLEDAAAHLPAAGGELCLLPGLHFANLAVSGRANIRIRGCAHRTWLLPRLATLDQPILSFTDCVDIAVSGLDLVAFLGAAVVAEGSVPGVARELIVADCRILARTECIRAHRLADVNIARNRVWLLDTAGGQAAISLRVTDGLVERNRVGVWPWQPLPPAGGGGPDDGGTTPPDDPCADPEVLYDNLGWVLGYIHQVWATVLTTLPAQPYKSWGGIHLRGGCEQVRLLDNRVDGGAGHGVTLGGLLLGELVPRPAGIQPEVIVDGTQMAGVVQDESGQGLSGIDVYLSRNGAVQHQTQSEEQGGFVLSGLAGGSYTVAVAPGYEVVELREVVIPLAATGVTLYLLVVRPVAVDLVEDQAHLYRILIRDNEIQRMALSGIGFMPYSVIPTAPVIPSGADPLEAQVAILNYLFAPRDLVGTCNVIQDLEIRGNRLHDNLLAVFTDLLRQAARTIGQGGISLALVENAVIADNHIQDNGLSAVTPVCGIFVGYAEDLEVSGNRISGNGALTEDYTGARIEGLRGGLFVRLASAFLLGGESDAFQRPALRITNNRIDQPAGRAVTAFAFGPVACEANHFNSEREGRWGLVDSLVGAMLILNLGGIHRQLLFATPAKAGAQAANTGAVPGIPGTQTYQGTAFADIGLGEGLLPGGETLVNGNQVRLGPYNRAYMAQLLMTLDDLGFDGNQSSTFRQDVLFANTLCLGQTLRATDNRFRERNVFCFLSLWSQAFGLTSFSKTLAMNTTAHNQGEHCIVATVPSSAISPVVDDNNLELLRDYCAEHAHGDNADGYFRFALVTSYLAENAPKYGDASISPQAVTQGVLGSFQGVSAAYRYTAQREAVRVTDAYGSDSTQAQAAQVRLARNAAALEQLRVQAELVAIQEIEPPADGTVLDGRVTDPAYRGKPDLTVELTRADGTSLGFAAKTDASGYFAVALDAEQIKALAKEQGVYLRVSDAQGQVLQQTKEPLAVAAGAPVRAEVVLPTKVVPRSVLAGGTVIFSRAGAGVARTSTPLENVRGIGPKTAAKLRAAGIPDVETLARTEASKLVEIAGFDARMVQAEAQKTLKQTSPIEAKPASGLAPGKGGKGTG